MSETSTDKGYLFLLSIGPVQSFIASARKAQDLWAGSFLLSHLVRIAVEHAENSGARVIFPLTGGAGSYEAASLPNHLLLFLKSGWDAEKIRNLGGQIKTVLEKEVKELAEHGKTQLNGTVADFTKRQTDDCLEVFWVAVPRMGDHQMDFAAVENALLGRKLIRNFVQPDTPEDSLKCSLCGERQALHEDGMASVEETKEYWGRDNRFKAGEYLCFICLGKRFAPAYFKDKKRTAQFRFPSTAEVAVSPYRQLIRLHARMEYELFETCALRTIKKEGCLLPANERIHGTTETLDGHWLFKDNYNDRELPGLPNEVVKGLHDGIETIRNSVRNQCGADGPSPYYAILIMDADRLGRKLSRVTDLELHSRFSKSLAEFAIKAVPEIVEMSSYHARLVYSGGDDLLAFVCVDHLLPLMEELRTKFACMMNAAFPALADGDPFTVSAGVCISHYKSPLRVALAQARAMLDLAKDNAGGRREAIAISVLSHSGNQKRTYAKWTIARNGVHLPVVNMLRILAKCLKKDGGLSDKFIYALRNEFRRCIDEEGKLVKTARSIQPWAPVRQEYLRLIQRASDVGKIAISLECAEKDALERLKELCDNLFCVTDEMNMNFKSFISLLETINIISRESVL